MHIILHLFSFFNRNYSVLCNCCILRFDCKGALAANQNKRYDCGQKTNPMAVYPGVGLGRGMCFKNRLCSSIIFQLKFKFC